MQNRELTTREKIALKHYREHFEKYSVEPTIRQLAAYLDVYPNAAAGVLKSLQRKGFLGERPVTKMRLTLSDKGKKVAL